MLFFSLNILFFRKIKELPVECTKCTNNNNSALNVSPSPVAATVKRFLPQTSISNHQTNDSRVKLIQNCKEIKTENVNSGVKIESINQRYGDSRCLMMLAKY